MRNGRAPQRMTPVTIGPSAAGMIERPRPPMPKKLVLHADRLFPADPPVRAIARRLYGAVQNLPIISPHGHTDPAWFADDEPFSNAAELLLAPDHYLYRMLYSEGIPLASLGLPSRQGPSEADPREAWRLLAR